MGVMIRLGKEVCALQVLYLAASHTLVPFHIRPTNLAKLRERSLFIPGAGDWFGKIDRQKKSVPLENTRETNRAPPPPMTL